MIRTELLGLSFAHDAIDGHILGNFLLLERATDSQADGAFVIETAALPPLCNQYQPYTPDLSGRHPGSPQ